MTRLAGVLAMAVVAVNFCGCSTIGAAHDALVEHPRRTVRYPSHTGEFLGAVVGIPVVVVLTPITIPMSHILWGDSEKAAWAPIYPAVHCMNFGSVLFGGIPWLLFGWWDMPETKPEPPKDTSEHLRPGTYVETESGSMIVGETSTNEVHDNIPGK